MEEGNVVLCSLKVAPCLGADEIFDKGWLVVCCGIIFAVKWGVLGENGALVHICDIMRIFGKDLLGFGWRGVNVYIFWGAMWGYCEILEGMVF